MTAKRTRAKRNAAAEQEVLDQPLSALAAHHPVVAEFMDERTASLPDSETIDMKVALQQILMGQNTILANQKGFGEELAKIKKRVAEQEKAMKAYQNNAAKYVENVYDKAEKLKRTGAAKDKIVATGVKQYQEAVQRATAERAVNELQFKKLLANGPKRTITSPGKTETIVVQGQPQVRVVPQTIRLRNVTFVLQPGVPTEVPKLVADIFEQRQRSAAETAERKALLSGNVKDVDLAAGIARVNRKYGSPSEGIPLASNA